MLMLMTLYQQYIPGRYDTKPIQQQRIVSGCCPFIFLYLPGFFKKRENLRTCGYAKEPERTLFKYLNVISQLI